MNYMDAMGVEKRQIEKNWRYFDYEFPLKIEDSWNKRKADQG